MSDNVKFKVSINAEDTEPSLLEKGVATALLMEEDTSSMSSASSFNELNYSQPADPVKNNVTTTTSGMPEHPGSIEARYYTDPVVQGPDQTPMLVSRLRLPIRWECFFILPNLDSRHALLMAEISIYDDAMAHSPLAFIHPLQLCISHDSHLWGAGYMGPADAAGLVLDSGCTLGRNATMGSQACLCGYP